MEGSPVDFFFETYSKKLIENAHVWQAQAACQTVPDKSIFFSSLPDDEELAKSSCHHCPVRRACLEYAFFQKESYGVWGGLSPIERRTYLRGYKIGGKWKKGRWEAILDIIDQIVLVPPRRPRRLKKTENKTSVSL